MDKIEQFIEWFGESVKIEDCDPAIYMINYFFDRFEFNQEQKYWYCWIYGTTYHFPTTYVIWNEFPDMELVGIDRLKDWNDKNYKRLRYQVDTKWNKGHLPEQFISYKNWVGNQSQHQKIQSLLTGEPNDDFEIMWKESKSWFKFGRYMAWFYLQVLKHCAAVNIEPQTLMLEDYAGSRSHRNGLCYALGENDLINQKLNPQQLKDFTISSEQILKETKKKYPKLEKKLDYFAMETCLCSFKKLFRISRGRYLGYYHDRQAEEIQQVEQDGWIGINWKPLWEAREESIQKQYLTNKIDTEKMKLFLQKNPLENQKQLHIIGGLPVSGKTTLMRSIREILGEPIKQQSNLLRYEEYPNHIILGIYNGGMFDGTDKLSMAVMEDAISFLKDNKKKVLVEGDRLFSKKFLNGAIKLGYDVKISICKVDSFQEILNRYKKRGQMQSMSFIKGRLTKLENITAEFPSEIINTMQPIPKKKVQSFL